MDKQIHMIQYDRYATEEGVFYTYEYIKGETYEYVHGQRATLVLIFEARYEGGIRYCLVFNDGVDMTINNRDDINLVWK